MARETLQDYGNFANRIFTKMKSVWGRADISMIGDGSVTGALSAMKARIDGRATDPVLPAYIVGTTAFKSDWLSDRANGSPITPSENVIYKIANGTHKNQLVMFNGIVYRLVGNVNIKDEFVGIPLRTESKNMGVGLETYAALGDTKWGPSITVTENMYKIEISLTGKKNNGGHFYVWWKGQQIMADSTPWSRTFILTPADKGSVLQTQCRGSTGTNFAATSSINGTATIYYQYNDYETLEYFPNTDTADGQAGLVPSAPSGTANAVLRNDGWGEPLFNIDDAQITNIFNNATPQAPSYSGEYIAGEYFGKTLYEQEILPSELATLDRTRIISAVGYNGSAVVPCDVGDTVVGTVDRVKVRYIKE